MTLAIQVSQLQQGYGKTVILKKINFELATGQICALIGPSGSGKTTLINSIMGMLAPQNMKRRLSLAIALLAEPDLLILDEPTVGIDPELRLNIWHELHQQASQGKAILLTTHVMADAQQADQLLLLQNGTLIAQGSPDQLMKKYQADSVEEVFLKAERRVSK